MAHKRLRPFNTASDYRATLVTEGQLLGGSSHSQNWRRIKSMQFTNFRLWPKAAVRECLLFITRPTRAGFQPKLLFVGHKSVIRAQPIPVITWMLVRLYLVM